MSDLAEKILDAIGVAEDGVPPLHIEGRYLGPRTEAERAVLRHCAADRNTMKACRDVLRTAPSDSDVALLAFCVLSDRARGYGIQPTPGGDHA